MTNKSEVHKVLVISTAHVTQEVAQMFQNSENPVPCLTWEHGWLLYLDVEDHIGALEWPRCLVNIGWRLRVLEAVGVVDNCRSVRLDSDAAKDEVLTVYDW